MIHLYCNDYLIRIFYNMNEFVGKLKNSVRMYHRFWLIFGREHQIFLTHIKLAYLSMFVVTLTNIKHGHKLCR